ncbi:MAG: hypothetical protein P1Q69_07170 [Candidatus Thorarchaeota archaeon]|nr:hypothetical protein [Candidatus Thorarchaeota archaeon]
MKLNEVVIGQNVSELIVRIVSIAPARIVSTRSGRKTQLREVLVADETGTAILSLWGFKEAKEILAGNVVKITDGWAKEWQGKMQLTLGRAGSIEEIPDDGSLPQSKELLKNTDSKRK